MTSSAALRGEIYWLDWSPGRGSEQFGVRPALIVQIDAANRNPRYRNTIVLAISTKGRDDVPFHVRLEPARLNGLNAVSYVHCEQVLTVDKSRLRERLGRVTGDDLGRVCWALRKVLGM